MTKGEGGRRPADRARAGRAEAAAEARRAEQEADADARALASVLRIRILRLCLHEPLTNKEVADRLGRDPGSTLHHIRRLAERGFLAAQPARRGARGAREIPYLATRKSFRTPVPGAAHLLVSTFLEEFAELEDPESALVGRVGVRLDRAGHDELHERLGALLTDLADRAPDPDGTPYSLFVVVHEDTARQRRE